jgi:hypothetical protein
VRRRIGILGARDDQEVARLLEERLPAVPEPVVVADHVEQGSLEGRVDGEPVGVSDERDERSHRVSHVSLPP